MSLALSGPPSNDPETPIGAIAGPISPAIPRRFPRKYALLGGTVGAAVVVALFLCTLVGTWAPVAHWTCATTESGPQFDRWLPAVLVNSPYGGTASGMGVLPAGFPGGSNIPIGWGTSVTNGTSAGAFFEVNWSVQGLGNVVTLGPGTNDRCSEPYRVVLESPPQYGGVSRIIPHPSSLTDLGEANNLTITAGASGTHQTPQFNNTFTASNSVPISTCGGPVKTIPVRTVGLTIGFSTPTNSSGPTLLYRLPLQQSFTYTFPANFGVWRVDNLSAPGGPGGGWAFSYSPCP